MSSKKYFYLVLFIFLVAFLVWQSVKPMMIFVIDEKFARPMEVTVPEGLDSVSAQECGGCHEAIYREWSQSVMARAWTDPYFQTDYDYEDQPQNCLNCHTPLVNQQEDLVLGFKDKAKLKPILEPNPDFNSELREQGVTCAVCHVKNGKIVGPFETDNAPHPVTVDPTMTSGMKPCEKCHVVSGNRWDTFYKMSPCGTVAEIEESGQELDCVGCHMPPVKRPVVKGLKARIGRRHLFWGGHVPKQVKKALRVEYQSFIDEFEKTAEYKFTLSNVGTYHYLPTGTPDRYLTLEFRLLDGTGKIMKEKTYKMKRYIMWRPFIIDLYDTRLPYNKPQEYTFKFSWQEEPPSILDVSVRYHLLDEKRRERIGYQNKEPIAYPIYEEKIFFGEKYHKRHFPE